MIDSILKIVASGIGMVAAYYLSKKLARWFQVYLNSRQKKEATDARTKAQADNQQANEEGDVLRDIDGR